MTISANSLRWDGAPPRVWVDFNSGHRTVTDEDTPTLHVGDRIVAWDEGDTPPIYLRARVTSVRPAVNDPSGRCQAIEFETFGVRADVFGSYEGEGMSFKGNYSWSDKVPEWDEVR